MKEQNEDSYLLEEDESFTLFLLKCFFASLYMAILFPVALITTFSLAFQIFVFNSKEPSIISEIVIATIIGIVLHLFVKKKTKMIENK